MFLDKLKFEKLKILSNKWAWYFYSPVYLIGSCLEHENYNDVDVVIILEDEDFERRYGSIKDWVDENNGFKKEIEVRNIWASTNYKAWSFGCDFTGLNLDVKILPKTYFEATYKIVKIRLDNFKKV